MLCLRAPVVVSSPPMSADSDTLVVFSDDWGRHPSSCQHLIGRLLDRYRVLWVNTVGTRAPTLGRYDLLRIAGKVGQWLRPTRSEAPGGHANLRVISPLMYPGFRTPWQRRFNADRLTKKVNAALGKPGGRRIAVTTIPIVADLVGRLRVDRWVYYCVDDFSVWPGLDGTVMDEMERQLVSRVDAAVAVSPTLQERLASMGRTSDLLTHGIDLRHWRTTAKHEFAIAPPLEGKPMALFWGVVDQRLDADWCLALADKVGVLMLVGPQQSPDPRLLSHPNIRLPGPMPYGELPGAAQAADVLVMPYADLPVTRAMQPLKFKEYLATGKPTVVRDLPSIRDWHDAADLVSDAETFVRVTLERAAKGVPLAQVEARRRLERETWEAKARMFERAIRG